MTTCKSRGPYPPRGTRLEAARVFIAEYRATHAGDWPGPNHLARSIGTSSGHAVRLLQLLKGADLTYRPRLTDAQLTALYAGRRYEDDPRLTR